jgi:hypothetical protein
MSKKRYEAIRQVAGFAECEPEEHSIRSLLYKHTPAGISCTFEKDKLVIHSIVEGVEMYPESVYLHYPFTEKEFWDACDTVNEEACEIWDATHGCEACGEEDPETGWVRINPDCPECRGGGTII